MKDCLFLFACMVLITANAQNKGAGDFYLLEKNTEGKRLFFIPTDTVYGWKGFKGYVSNEDGRTILKEGLMLACTSVPEVELTGNFTLYGKEDTVIKKAGTAYSNCWYTFNQKGEFLYHPYDTAGGTDPWRQGTRRMVHNDRMGLVDREGSIMIPAQNYQYIEAAKWGLVAACKRREAGADYTATRYDLYAIDGRLLLQDLPYNALAKSPESARKLADKYAIRYKSAETEKRLGTILLQLPEIQQYLKEKVQDERQYHFVVYARPSALSPYYFFGLEAGSSNEPETGVHFLISTEGRYIYYLKQDLQLEMPYQAWKKLPEEERFKNE